ncbi:MAG: hypothetical protein WD740_07450 [Anaerolineales bacterium]
MEKQFRAKMGAIVKGLDGNVGFGWGVPMPLPVKSRRYDQKFWDELLGKGGGKRSAKDINEELGF